MTRSELKTLMGAYYHQDFETLWGALDEYLSDSSPDELRLLLPEIAGVCESHSTDIELEGFLDRLGNCADRSQEPGGYRGWLEEIARRVRLHLGD